MHFPSTKHGDFLKKRRCNCILSFPYVCVEYFVQGREDQFCRLLDWNIRGLREADTLIGSRNDEGSHLNKETAFDHSWEVKEG